MQHLFAFKSLTVLLPLGALLTSPALAGSKAAPKLDPGKKAGVRDAGVEPLPELGPFVPSPPRFKWDLPTPLAQVDVPGVMQANGVPVKLHAVVVKGKAGDLARYIIDSFHRQNLYVPPREHVSQPGAEPIIVAYDPEAMISYSVIFQTNTDNTVTLILGEANMGAIKAPTGADFAPLFPGAKGVMRTHVEGMRTMSFVAPGSSVEVQAFYESALGKAGYKKQESGTFRRGTEEISVTTRLHDGKTSVLLTTRTAPPDDFGRLE